MEKFVGDILFHSFIEIIIMKLLITFLLMFPLILSSQSCDTCNLIYVPSDPSSSSQNCIDVDDYEVFYTSRTLSRNYFVLILDISCACTIDLSSFFIANSNAVTVTAEARIVGSRIIVTSDYVRDLVCNGFYMDWDICN